MSGKGVAPELETSLLSCAFPLTTHNITGATLSMHPQSCILYEKVLSDFSSLCLHFTTRGKYIQFSVLFLHFIPVFSFDYSFWPQLPEKTQYI